MVKRRGVVGWMPKALVSEADDIMREEGLNKRADAIQKMVQYAQVGRELKRLSNLNTNWAKKRPPKKYTRQDLLENDWW